MKIALVQLDIAWRDREANLRRAEEHIRCAGEDGCDLAVLPEMFNTGFCMDIEATAEDRGGPTERALCRLAERHGVAVLAGLTERSEGGRAVNLAVTVGASGEVIGRQAKLHPFPVVGEAEKFVPGDRPEVINIVGERAAVFVCYDLRFPEVFRMAMPEARLVFVIANWPASRREHWDALLAARAIENQCYVVGVNRAGIDGNKVEYNGGSKVVGPLGRLVMGLPDGAEYGVAELDMAEVGKVRSRFPFLADMRHIGKGRD